MRTDHILPLLRELANEASRGYVGDQHSAHIRALLHGIFSEIEKLEAANFDSQFILLRQQFKQFTYPVSSPSDFPRYAAASQKLISILQTPVPCPADSQLSNVHGGSINEKGAPIGANVFFSHSSKDKSLARRIATDLVNAGIEVWLDEWNIFVGDSITQKIQHGLDSADFVAVLLTEKSICSGWVEKEWQSLIGREAERREVSILPLLAEKCRLPTLLRDKRFADFTGDYSTAIKELIKAIKQHSLRSPGARRSIYGKQLLSAKEVVDILIIEDDLEFGYRLSQILGEMGFSISIASDERSAFAIFNRYGPPMVIVDASWIGVAEGYSSDLASKLRELKPGVLLVGLLRHARYDSDSPVYDQFDHVFLKPITIEDLKQKIEELMNSRRA